MGCRVAWVPYSCLVHSDDLGGQEAAESKNDRLEEKHCDEVLSAAGV